MKSQNGFTKVEILAVIGIVVVTSALAAFAVNAARVKQRDAVFLKIVAGTIPTGLKHRSTCGQPARDAFCYSVREGGGNYAIQFELESSVAQAGIVKGLNCALPSGIKAGPCL